MTAPRRVVVARAPGRVNLIGDHTDYCGGLALPMAVDLVTEVELTEDDLPRLRLHTDIDPAPADLGLDTPFDPALLVAISPAWARLGAAVLAQVRPARGGIGRVSSTLPTGAGLSSSAAFCVALATALGVEARPATMARLCQRAEAATGVDVGLMDPLVASGARAGHAMLVDFATLATRQVPLPESVEVVVVHSGQSRRLAGSPYRVRRAECDAAAAALGRPLGQAEPADIAGMLDPLLRRRARHVVGECLRVRAFAAALSAGDLAAAGTLMTESHRSLAEDFEASTPRVESLVGALSATSGVHGARMTGGGFGGCVVALAEPGALDPAAWPGRAWRVAAAGGATMNVLAGA